MLVSFDVKQTILLLSTTLLLLRLPFPGLLLQIGLHIFGGRENAGSKTYRIPQLLTVEAFCTVWFSLSTITGAYPRSVKRPSEQASIEQVLLSVDDSWATLGNVGSRRMLRNILLIVEGHMSKGKCAQVISCEEME